MITLVMIAGMQVTYLLPQQVPCNTALRVRLADGTEIVAVKATYNPTTRHMVITPALAGRVFCDGFEERP